MYCQLKIEALQLDRVESSNRDFQFWNFHSTSDCHPRAFDQAAERCPGRSAVTDIFIEARPAKLCYTASERDRKEFRNPAWRTRAEVVLQSG